MFAGKWGFPASICWASCEKKAGRFDLIAIIENRLEQDAYAVARWMAQMNQRGVLGSYFTPPLSVEERVLAAREGWIFGVV